ncbi:MAG: cytochrome c oxidase accessory protein CcoG, partial [Candidatus Marinimicrobia bacterium CG_4_9_14_3_um_filter_48_9]
MVEKDSERRARENPVPDEKGTYRDRLATVDSSGKRSWIYPKKPSGRFYRARNWVSLFLLIILFSGPFITINGHPILLLNILERKFIILGMVFWPQDFILFGLAMIAVIVSIVLFT